MHIKSSFICFLGVIVLGVSANAAGAPAANTNLFHSPTAGFTVVKPAAWQFASMEEVAAHRAVAHLKDKELEEQIRKRVFGVKLEWRFGHR